MQSASVLKSPAVVTFASLLGMVALSALVVAEFEPVAAAEEAGAPAKAPQEKGPKWEIPWLEGTKLESKTRVIQQLGRLGRNDLWDSRPGSDIRFLCEYILTELDPSKPQFKDHPATVKDFQEMRAYASFYKARLLGRDLFFNPPADETARTAKKAEILALVQQARALGYTNHEEIAGARELFVLEDDPQFRQLVGELAEAAEKRIRSGYARRTDELFARFARGEPGSWRPALRTVGDPPVEFFPSPARPMALVLCRTHHDGLIKYLPVLEAFQKRHGDAMAFGIVFHQLSLDDPAPANETERTKEWRAKFEKSFPCTVIDRAQYRELRDLLERRFTSGGKEGDPQTYEIFEPVIVFFTADGTPVFQANGVLRDWQLEFVVEKFRQALGVVPTAAPPAPAEGEKNPEGSGEPEGDDKPEGSEPNARDAKERRF
jgi:hypothetical protein